MRTSSENSENKSKKRLPGRPKKAIKRSDILMVRLSPTEKLLIGQRAESAGLKPSEWFRKAAKSAKVYPRFTTEEIGWFKTLYGLANNLNQLTHLAHVNGLLSLAIKCQGLLREIEELLHMIRKDDRQTDNR